MRRKALPWLLLTGAWLYLSSPCWNSVVLLDIQQLHVTKKCRFCDKIISLPLVSGIMLLWLASLYMQMLALGGRRSDRSFLSLAIFLFLMKFEFSCQSLELISRIAQPVCLNNIEEDAAFLYPTNCKYFSTHPFYSYFWTKHPHLLFPQQS